ncbi:hypothetical protein AAFC00_001936 [Neodothiora populina]|uniref:HIG1 domain-containing protein n=1 Tax=Neodothiora populina TaxID=2781224 RepID=A0ABR3PQP1_9PEZI
MKVLSKEHEDAHYRYMLRGGIGGGVAGTAVGAFALWGASRRFPAFSRALTLPFKSFLVASSGLGAGYLSADRWSRSFEAMHHPDNAYHTTTKQEVSSVRKQLKAQKTPTERWQDWAQQNKYSIVLGSWVVSMAAALAVVSKNRYLSGQQKLMQARVYAQGLTMAVVVATLALETHDKTQGVTLPSLENAARNQWKDMVAASERRMMERGEPLKF